MLIVNYSEILIPINDLVSTFTARTLYEYTGLLNSPGTDKTLLDKLQYKNLLLEMS